jgi:hypothetical protein
MKRFAFFASLLALLGALLLAASPAPAVAAEPPVIAIPVVQADPGATVDVAITVDTRGVGIRGYGLNLDFDPTRIEIESFTDGGFLGDCPGGAIYEGYVVIDNVAGTLKGASATFLGCPTKSVSTAPDSPAALGALKVKVKSGASNGKMNWVFAANTKLIDANAGNMLPPKITLTPNWLQIGTGQAVLRTFVPMIAK